MREETKFRVDSKDKGEYFSSFSSSNNYGLYQLDEKMPRAHVNSRRRTIASVKAVPMEQSATLLNFYPILPKKALDALKDDEQIIKPLNEFSVDMHHQNKENKLLLANGCATTAAGDLSSEKHSLEPELTAAEKARKLLQKPLALPKKYDRIFNAFQALESVYILHKGRGQENELEFHKIAKSVRNIISRLLYAQSRHLKNCLVILIFTRCDSLFTSSLTYIRFTPHSIRIPTKEPSIIVFD